MSLAGIDLQMSLAGIDSPKSWPVNAASILVGLYRGWDGSMGEARGRQKLALAKTPVDFHNCTSSQRKELQA